MNWEKGSAEPAVVHFPAILRFLGYDPFPEPTTLSERLLRKRRHMGWTFGKAARRLGVDPGTWRDWEAGGVILYQEHRSKLARLLDVDLATLSSEMTARWAELHGSEGRDSSA